VVRVTGIILDKSSVTLNVGDTSKLTVDFTPSNTTQKMLTFSTGNKNVATIAADGTVKAVKAGKTVITVISYSNKAITAKCNVTVKAKEPVTLTLEVFDRGNVGGTPPDNNYWTKWIKGSLKKQIRISSLNMLPHQDGRK
jgi:uncharacterized protein YjdB